MEVIIVTNTKEIPHNVVHFRVDGVIWKDQAQTEAAYERIFTKPPVRGHLFLPVDLYIELPKKE